MKRRERTRQLIELGGLIAKAGLIEITNDDRATIFGALLNVAATLQGERRDEALLLWRRRGKRGFAALENRGTGDRDTNAAAIDPADQLHRPPASGS